MDVSQAQLTSTKEGGNLAPGTYAPAPAAELSGVSKIFGSTVAVSNVSFSLFTGEVLALVGENGAGA